MNIPANSNLTHRLNQDPATGSYQGEDGVEQLELRIDLEHKMVSGDFFQLNTQPPQFIRSFQSDDLEIKMSSGSRFLTGSARINPNNTTLRFELIVAIPQVLTPPAQVVAKFIFTDNTTRSFSCRFKSQFFRMVEFEMDVVTPRQPPVIFDLERPLADGTTQLTLISAFQRAGIELKPSGETSRIPANEAGDNLRWSIAELHAAMQRYFSLHKDDPHRDTPQWKFWVLVATLSEEAPLTNRGVMFDREGSERQGCVVFDELIANDTHQGQLRTYVHEIGHCFNLLHSGQKKVNGVLTPRIDSLSWMNFPIDFPCGPNAFWNRFQFEFDPQELHHLHHGAYLDVAMGGNKLGRGAGDMMISLRNTQSRPSLQLEIKIQSQNLRFAEPVFVELKLSTTQPNTPVVPLLHPRKGLVKILIEKPDGSGVFYESIEEVCAEMSPIPLMPNNPVQDLVYIGYGKDGFYFDQPGRYQLQAIYFGRDGVIVLSNQIELTVNAMLTGDKAVTRLFLGPAQGRLLYLLGSDSSPDAGADPYLRFLDTGNAAFLEILTRHPNHPFAMYVRLIFGINAQRDFKTISSGATILIRQADFQKSIELLLEVYKRLRNQAIIGFGLLNSHQNEPLLLKMVRRFIVRSISTMQSQPLTQLTLIQLSQMFNISLEMKTLLLSIISQADARSPFQFWFPGDSGQ